MALELFEDLTGLDWVARAIEVAQAFLDPIGDGDLGPGITESEQRPQTLGGTGVELLFTHHQGAPYPIERVVLAAPVPDLLVLDTATHGIEAAVGERDDVEGVDDLAYSAGGEPSE